MSSQITLKNIDIDNLPILFDIDYVKLVFFLFKSLFFIINFAYGIKLFWKKNPKCNSVILLFLA